MPLTDATIKNVKPGQKAVKLFDGGGLYLEVAPSGGKWWRLRYRSQGKEKRISLGIYPQIGLKEARERREQTKKLLAEIIEITPRDAAPDPTGLISFLPIGLEFNGIAHSVVFTSLSPANITASLYDDLTFNLNRQDPNNPNPALPPNPAPCS